MGSRKKTNLCEQLGEANRAQRRDSEKVRQQCDSLRPLQNATQSTRHTMDQLHVKPSCDVSQSDYPVL